MTSPRLFVAFILVILAALVLMECPTDACTGITLKAKDGAVVFGRTLEWGAFDLNSRLVVIPRSYEFKSRLQGGQAGFVRKTVYGAVGHCYPSALCRGTASRTR